MAPGEDDEELNDISQTIYDLRNWNPPPIVPDSPVEPVLTRSTVFYDKHVSQQLSLKRIVGVPTLLHSLTDIVDDIFVNLVNKGMFLPDFSDEDMFVAAASTFKHINKKRSDAASVADYYRDSTARCCKAISCTLLYPHMRAWYTFLAWGRVCQDPAEVVILDNHTLRVNYEGKDIPLYKGLWESLSEEEAKVLQGVSLRFPFLATWIIFPPSKMAEDIIQDLEKDVMSFRIFDGEVCPVQGYARISDSEESARADIIDSDTFLSFLPEDTHRQRAGSIKPPDRRRSSRLIQKPGTNPVDHSSSSDVKVTLPSRRRYNAAFRPLNDRDAILQHAWRRSIENDTTFIIFHCGTHERIGIRRRESQTLYLSPFIDVSNCRHPWYGDIQLNLYIAIFQDAVDRYHRTTAVQESSSNKKRKRGATETSPRRSKRQKASSAVPESAAETVSSQDILPESTTRNVAFLSLRYGPFDSKAPAAFIRDSPTLISGHPTSPSVASAHERQRKYSPHQCITVVMTSHIGDGAVGVVHGAELEVQTKEGKTLSSKAVVKLAFSDVQKEKLRYEYSIYQRLVGSSVRGISRVFGLFQDLADGGPLALILSHQGLNLWFCRRKKVSHSYDDMVQTSDEERVQFLRIMKEIHRAGVAHNDIRAENLLISDDSGPAIIDFDRATVDPTRGAQQRERKELSALLKGFPTDPMPSYMIATPPDAVFSDTDAERE